MKDTPYFIARFTLVEEFKYEKNWTQHTWQCIEDHANYLSQLGERGILLCAGRTLVDMDSEDLFGIAIVQSTSLETAKELFKKDPAVTNEIQTVSVFPFSLGIQYFDNADKNI